MATHLILVGIPPVAVVVHVILMPVAVMLVTATLTVLLRDAKPVTQLCGKSKENSRFKTVEVLFSMVPPWIMRPPKKLPKQMYQAFELEKLYCTPLASSSFSTNFPKTLPVAHAVTVLASVVEIRWAIVPSPKSVTCACSVSGCRVS